MHNPMPSHLARKAHLVLLTGIVLHSPLPAEQSVPGTPIDNQDWGILMTPEGYSDVIIDDWTKLDVPFFFDFPRAGANRFIIPRAFIEELPEGNFSAVEAIFED